MFHFFISFSIFFRVFSPISNLHTIRFINVLLFPYSRLCISSSTSHVDYIRRDIWLWIANMLKEEARSGAGQFPGG